MRRATLLAVLCALPACGKRHAPVPDPAASAPPVGTSAASPLASTPPVASSAPPAASAVPSASAPPAVPVAPDKTFTHATLGFRFSYPGGLTARGEAKGARVSGAALSTVPDRSGRSKAGIAIPMTIQVKVEAGGVAAVASKNNAAFVDAFPDASVAEFKEQPGFSERVVTASGTGYRFVIGSHGVGEIITFLPAKTGHTFVVTCSTVSDTHAPTTGPEDQAAACDKVVSTLQP